MKSKRWSGGREVTQWVNSEAKNRNQVTCITMWRFIHSAVCYIPILWGEIIKGRCVTLMLFSSSILCQRVHYWMLADLSLISSSSTCSSGLLDKLFNLLEAHFPHL